MINVYLSRPHPTLSYAAEELRRYLGIMLEAKTGGGSVFPSFRLGLTEDLGIRSEVADPTLDDHIFIDTEKNGGVIAGNNPGSVLLAVYEYLRQNGCRWLFPGKEGEYIPKRGLSAVKLNFKPASRYRGPCIEGAVTQQILLDTLEFLPKLGMNTFMSQFAIPTVFYHRYASAGYNTVRRPERVDRAQVAAWKEELIASCRLRGIRFHDMGHGWTVMPFGVTGADTWRPEEGEVTLPEENRRHLALLGGERGLRDGKPLITNFCMSSPKAVAKVAEYVANYAEEHPEVSVLHVWLSDSFNGHCECDACSKKTASDWYVVTLNAIDEAMTARGIDTSVIFCAYNDTVFAPTEERIKNPDRFTLMICPIRRKYLDSYRGDTLPTPPKYRRNDITLPNSLEDYLAHLEQWRRVFPGRVTAYEYHFWRFQALDVSGLDIARRIYEDIRSYRTLGVDGMIACGSQRSYFPTGLAYYVYARALFDGEATFDGLVMEYFTAAFGPHSSLCLKYLRKISELFDYGYMSGAESEDPSVSLYYSPARGEMLGQVRKVTASMRYYLSSLTTPTDPTVRKSLELISHHTDYADMIADFLIPCALGDKDTATSRFAAFKEEMSRREDELKPYFDHWLFIAYLERIIRTDDKWW